MLTNVPMNKRLQQFIFAENISQSALADSLGVARASVSHILSGRNKPGFDFIENLTRAYPALNIEWLITGEGKMYKTAKSLETTPQETPMQSDASEYDLFSALPEDENPLPAAETKIPSAAPQPQSPRANSAERIDINTSSKAQQPIIKEKSITKIIVFFSDGSFREIAA